MLERPKLSLAFAVISALSLAGCAPAESDSPSVLRAPEARVVGEAVSCLTLTQIASTQVHDDRTIDFKMHDNRIYRNTLPARCPTLGMEQRFSYTVSTGRLCNTDIIHVLTPEGRESTACGLGQFVPVELVTP